MKFNFTKFVGYFNLAIGITNMTAASGEPFGMQAACGVLGTVSGCWLLAVEVDK